MSWAWVGFLVGYVFGVQVGSFVNFRGLVEVQKCCDVSASSGEWSDVPVGSVPVGSVKAV